MSMGEEIAPTVLQILQRHALPGSLKFDESSARKIRTSVLKAAIMADYDVMRVPHRITGNSTLEQELQDALGEIPTTAIGTTVMNQLSSVTSVALGNSNQQALLGEAGLSHFLYGSLIMPLNMLIQKIGRDAYWRVVGTGKGGRPDFELMKKTTTGDVRIATLELKTPCSVPRRIVYDLCKSLRGSEITTMMVHEGGEFRLDVEDETAGVQGIIKTTRRSLIKQVWAQVGTRTVDYAILTDYDVWMVFARGGGPNGPYMSISLPVYCHAQADQHRLHNSPLGLMLGVTLLAIEKKEIRVPIPGNVYHPIFLEDPVEDETIAQWLNQDPAIVIQKWHTQTEDLEDE